MKAAARILSRSVMKTTFRLMPIWLCAAVAGAGELSAAATQQIAGEPEQTAAMMEIPPLPEHQLLHGGELILLGRIAKNRVPMPEGVLEPELPALMYQLKDNLRCQFYIAQRQRQAGSCSDVRMLQLREKFEELGMEPSTVVYSKFNLYITGLEGQSDSELTQFMLRCVRETGLMDWLTGLELEEKLLRIRIEGVRGFNVTPEGEQYKKELKENLERQLVLAKERVKVDEAPVYEPMLLKEKLLRWCETPSAMESYLNHESEQVRHTAAQLLQGAASWEELLAEEERWLLEEITSATRAHRLASPAEAQLQNALEENLQRQNELMAADAAAQQEQTLNALRTAEKTLRARLTWFPTPAGAAASLVQQLRENLRCRLFVAEQGAGSAEAVAELKEKLALCPKTSAEQDCTPADEEQLNTYLSALETSADAMVQYAAERYKEGQCSLSTVLETEAQRLHICILGQAVLHHVPGDKIPLIARLEANLLRQLKLAQQKQADDNGSSPAVLTLREKLSSWFSK